MLTGQDLEQKVAEVDSDIPDTPERSESLAITPDDEGVFRTAVARMFDMESKDDLLLNKDRLDRMITWARGRGAIDRIGVIAELTQFRNSFGRPSMYNMGMLIHLDNERMAISNEMNKFNDHG